MTTAAWILLGAATLVAVVDWQAVARRPSPVEVAAKPLTLVLLVGVALALDPSNGAQRSWFVVALVLSLVGDVLLLPQVERFEAGLAAFLLAHVAYVVGFVAVGVSAPVVLGTLVVVALVAVPLAARMARGARSSGHPEVVVPVLAYVAVITVMVAVAVGSGVWLAALGALVFMVSDALIGWTRFVGPVGGAPVAIMVTYHVGQAGLVVSLVT